MNMMNTLKRAAVVLAVLVPAMLSASVTSDVLALRRARSKSVKMGVWHADLNKARAYAEENGMPLIAMWSNGEGCSHCLVMENTILAPVFKDWMKNSGCVFYFGVVDDGPYGPTADGQEGYHGTSFYWCRKKEGNSDPNASENWPYVRIYWRKANGKLKQDVFRTGASLDGEWVMGIRMPAKNGCETEPARWQVKGDDGTYNPSARYMIHCLTNSTDGLIKGYTYNPTPKYTGGEFIAPNVKTSPDGGMELECGSSIKQFEIALSRTNTTSQTLVSTNYLSMTFPSGKTQEIKVDWAKSQQNAYVPVPVDSAWLKQDQYVEVVLLDAGRKAVETNYVKCVAPVENSSLNPLWIGEKENFDWGEWTMDIDAATNKVNAETAKGGSAYTLVLIGGPIWCPDCVNLEEHLILSKEFKAWTAERKVACVAVDVPKFGKGYRDTPTLLSPKALDSKGTLKGGAGYLTRKGVPMTGNGNANATSVLERNLRYVEQDTDHGGLRLPEADVVAKKKTRVWGAGVPCLILLRPDGTVAGRIYQFSNSSTLMTQTDPKILVQRLDELVDQVGEPSEERNDSWKSTPDAIGAIEFNGITRTLSFADAADYYRIDATKGSDIIFTVEPEKSATMTVSVIDTTSRKDSSGAVIDPDAAPVATVTSESGEAVQLTAENIPSSKCYLKVSYPQDGDMYPTDSYYALNKSGSTLQAYTVKSYSILRAEDVDYTVTNGDSYISISLSAGQAYRFVGLDAGSAANQAVLDYDVETGLYTAKESGATMLDLEKDESGNYVFTYQQWNPGIIGFEKQSGSCGEPDDNEVYDYQINIRRTGGTSGEAAFKLVLVPGESTSLTDGSVYVWEDADKVFRWRQGETHTTSTVVRVVGNVTADGNQQITFRLVQAGGDAEVSASLDKYTMTIRDDDEPVPGTLALVSANGQPLSNGKVIYAAGGSSVELLVDRNGGSAGMLTCELVADGVGIDPVDGWTWQSRDGGEKTFSLTLPEYVSGAGNKVTVTLKGVDGAHIDAAARDFIIRILPKDVVAFDTDSVSLVRTRYVAGSEQEIPVGFEYYQGGTLTVTKLSGVMPSGMSAEFDPERGMAGALVVSGTPTMAGQYTAVYQLSEDGIAGGTVVVSVNVTDPVSSTPGSAASNPSLAVSRTFNDILVVNSEAAEVVGLLNLTVVRSGRLSARYRPYGYEAVSLLSTNWESVSSSGEYSVTLLPVDSAEGVSLDVSVRSDGRLEVEMNDDRFEGSLRCYVPVSEWSQSSPATPWKGVYNVSLPRLAASSEPAFASGDAYVQLRMTSDQALNRGIVTYAGILPTGKAFSGSATLSDYPYSSVVLGETGRALPILSESSGDFLAAVCLLDYMADSCRKVFSLADLPPRWDHVESVDGVMYSVRLNAVGCLYDPSVDYVGCCTNKFGTQELNFFAITSELVSNLNFAHGSALPWAVENAKVNVSRSAAGLNKIKVTSDAAKNGLTLSLDRENGLVSGQLRVDFADGTSKTASYRGIVMPGWGNNQDCDCADAECDQRPFVSGSCWFSDGYSYMDSKGRLRETSLKRGFPFSIGKHEGR